MAEDSGIPISKDRFLPGRFYSLEVTPEVPELTPEVVSTITNGKPYYDLNPIGLVLFNENWKQTVLILNLKVIPVGVSYKLLHAYYEFSRKNGLENLYLNDKLISLEERLDLNQRFYHITTTILSNMLGIKNLNYAINKYSMESISNIKLIDWDNFGMLAAPLFSDLGLFPENINMEEIFNDFIQNSINT